MIIWMVWATFVATTMALAGLAADRIASYIGAPRRQIWIVAVAIGTILPIVVATRQPRAGGEASPRMSVAAAGARTGAAVAPPMFVSRSVARVSASAVRFDRWIAGLWLLASTVVAIAFLRATLALRTQRRRWRAVRIGACDALVSPAVGPAVIGFLRPRIVVPEWALSLDRSAQEMMLLHETEHIRAGDPRALLFAGVLLVVAPWNAALWWMARRLRLAIEIDCDARVIRAVDRPHDYGLVLLAVGERYATPLPLAASLSEPRPLLERRIHAMTSPRPRRPILASIPFAAAALLAATVAWSTPRPAPLGPISFAAPRETPLSKAQIKGLIDKHFAAVVRGEQEADYAVLLFDAAGNYVWGTTGKGGAMIAVEGDTLSYRDRKAVQATAAAAAGIPSNGSAGRGGRGGRGGGRGASGSATSTGSASVAGTIASGDSARQGYAVGVMRMTPGQPASVNEAAGLTKPSRAASGIDGIPATSIGSVDIYGFSEGQVGNAPSFKVLAVNLIPGAPAKKP